MAYLQERMVHYLTCDPHLFVAEERVLWYGDDKNKEFWYIDAFVVSPWEKTFYLGEATYNVTPAPLVKKLHLFADRYNDVLDRLIPAGEPRNWVVRPWLFVRNDAVTYVIKHLPNNLPANATPRISCLEMTAFPWIYEKCRNGGKEIFPDNSPIEPRFRSDYHALVTQ